MLKSKSRYYYTRLDDADRLIYDSILSGWEARNPNPSFITNPLKTKDDIQKIIRYVAYDNPGLFYVDFGRYSLAYSAVNTTVQSKFLYNDRQIADYEKQLQSAIAGILAAHKFDSMDKYDRELVLHDYLVKNVSYADGDTDSGMHSVIGALVSRRAVCEGYAKAFKLLCDQVGVPCIVVSGMGTPLDRPEELHAWNIVKLDGACAHVDVTWDSSTRGDSDTCYDHFNLTDEDAAKDHTWDRALLPACTSSQNNYYVRNKQCVGNRAEFKGYVASQVKKGKKVITVRLAGQERTPDQVMNAVQEALREIQFFGYTMNLRYNQKRGTALIRLDY